MKNRLTGQPRACVACDDDGDTRATRVYYDSVGNSIELCNEHYHEAVVFGSTSTLDADDGDGSERDGDPSRIQPWATPRTPRGPRDTSGPWGRHR